MFQPTPAIIKFSSETVLLLYKIYDVMSWLWGLIICDIY